MQTSANSTRCGLANGTLNKARNTKAGLSSDTLEKIPSSNPDLSADWLFRGYQDDVLIEAEPPAYYQKEPSTPSVRNCCACWPLPSSSCKNGWKGWRDEAKRRKVVSRRFRPFQTRNAHQGLAIIGGVPCPLPESGDMVRQWQGRNSE